MRFLPISDTHGKLGVVNELAARAQADASRQRREDKASVS